MREEGLSDPHSVGQVVSQWLGVACLVSFIHPPIHSLSVHPVIHLSIHPPTYLPEMIHHPWSTPCSSIHTSIQPAFHFSVEHTSTHSSSPNSTSPPLCSPPDFSDRASGPGLIPWSREQMYLIWHPQAWRWGFSGNWQYQCEVLTKESRSESVRCSVVSDSLRPCGLQSKLLCPRGSPGENTGVGCHFLLQGIFSNQGLNPGLLHSRLILYQLRHRGWKRPAISAYDPLRNQIPCGLQFPLSIIKPSSYKPNKMAAGKEGIQARPESFPGRRSSRSGSFPWRLCAVWHWTGQTTSLNLSSPIWKFLHLNPSLSGY